MRDPVSVEHRRIVARYRPARWRWVGCHRRRSRRWRRASRTRPAGERQEVRQWRRRRAWRSRWLHLRVAAGAREVGGMGVGGDRTWAYTGLGRSAEPVVVTGGGRCGQLSRSPWNSRRTVGPPSVGCSGSHTASAGLGCAAAGSSSPRRQWPPAPNSRPRAAATPGEVPSRRSLSARGGQPYQDEYGEGGGVGECGVAG